MVSLACDATERDGVTLVTARLEGGTAPQRVRLANRLDGEVWPPRRRGVPEEGWTDDGYEGVVPAGATVALGYASPAPPLDDPLELVEKAVLDDPATSEAPTAETAVRELGDPAPPRDAVALPAVEGASPRDTDSEQSRRRRQPSGPEQSTDLATSVDQQAGDPPQAVTEWLDTVENRLVTAEALSAANSVPEATDALRAAGGLDGATETVDRLAADARALEAVATRARALADRESATDVPLETLERIA